jgi:3-(3-hydroxy-phenyl)propionate hydroxylase
LVSKSRNPRGLAGALCPNPALAQGVRLDEVIANRFALITSSPLREHHRDELARRGAAVIFAEPGSALCQWLRHGRATAAIVRPDSTVMQAGRNTEALCEALPPFHPSCRAPDHVPRQSKCR